MRNTHPNKVNLFIDGEYKADCEHKINYNITNDNALISGSITGGTINQYIPYSSINSPKKYKILPRSIYNSHTKLIKPINFLIF